MQSIVLICTKARLRNEIFDNSENCCVLSGFQLGFIKYTYFIHIASPNIVINGITVHVLHRIFPFIIELHNFCFFFDTQILRKIWLSYGFNSVFLFLAAYFFGSPNTSRFKDDADYSCCFCIYSSATYITAGVSEQHLSFCRTGSHCSNFLFLRSETLVTSTPLYVCSPGYKHVEQFDLSEPNSLYSCMQ